MRGIHSSNYPSDNLILQVLSIGDMATSPNPAGEPQGRTHSGLATVHNLVLETEAARSRLKMDHALPCVHQRQRGLDQFRDMN